MSEDFNSFPSRLTQTALSNISEILKRTRDATNRSAEPIIKQENQKNIERLVSDMRQNITRQLAEQQAQQTAQVQALAAQQEQQANQQNAATMQ